MSRHVDQRNVAENADADLTSHGNPGYHTGSASDQQDNHRVTLTKLI